MAAPDHLPHRAALALGLVFAAVGLAMVLLAVGVIGSSGAASDAP